MIFTSYFANIKNLPEDFNLIVISRTMPKGIKHSFTILEDAKPSGNLLWKYKQGSLAWEQYEQIYRFETDYKLPYIYNAIKDQNCILLCWEAPDKHCHRHILATMLKDAYNLAITEFR